LDSPKSVHHYIAGPEQRHRFESAARDAQRCNTPLIGLVKTVDFITTHSPVLVLGIWGCLTVFNVFNSWGDAQSSSGNGLDVFVHAVSDSFNFLAWSAISVLTLSATYVVARGPKKPNCKAYLEYYPKLEGSPDAQRLRAQGILDPRTDSQRRQFVSRHTGHMAWLASQSRWDAITNMLISTQTTYREMLGPLLDYAVQLRNSRIGLKNDKAYAKVSKQLISQWLTSSEDWQESVRCDALVRLISDAEDAVHLELLAPLLTSEQLELKALAFSALFRLALTTIWGDPFLASFKALYSHLSSAQQADANRYFSMFRNKDYIRKAMAFGLDRRSISEAIQRLSVAFLIATKDCTKPTALTEKETAIMLGYVMPVRKRPQSVYSWQDAWLQLSQTFAGIQKRETLFSITRSYINRFYLESVTHKDPEGVAMFLLAACQALPTREESDYLKHIIKKIIDSGKLLEVLRVLMQTVYQKSVMYRGHYLSDHIKEDLNGARFVAESFINVLLKKEDIVLRPEEAAWLCHLYGRGNNIAQTVVSIYFSFPNSSWDTLDSFQEELLTKALDYIRVTDVPLRANSQDLDAIISDCFYFQRWISRMNPSNNDYVLEEQPNLSGFSDQQKKAIRILGFGEQEIASLGDPEAGKFAASAFLSELVYQAKKSPEERNHSLVSLYYWRLSNLFFKVSQDVWRSSERDHSEAQSVRGALFKQQIYFLEILANRNEGHVDPGNKDILDRLVYFLLTALLNAREMELQHRCTYFAQILGVYFRYLGKETLSETLFELHSAADRFREPHGALCLVLGWAQALFLHGREAKTYELESGVLAADQADRIALDLLGSVDMPICAERFRAASASDFVPNPRMTVWQIMAKFDEAQVDAYLKAAPPDSLTRFIWGTSRLEQPERMLKGLRCYWEKETGCQNNINATFDQLGFIEDAHEPFRSDPNRFPIINVLLAHCISEIETPGIAHLLAIFIDTVRDEDVQHHLGPFYTLAGWPLSVEDLSDFKASLFSFTMSAEFRDGLKTRTAAMLIYSLHPEELPSNVVRLFQSPHCFDEEVQQILEVFEFPTSLVEAESLCQQLQNFGMQEAKLQRLIMLINSSNRENPTSGAPLLPVTVRGF